MQCGDQASVSSEEIHAAIDSILEEDRHERSLRGQRTGDHCDSRQRHIGVTRSKRFSIRVMEALRAIHRLKQRNRCPTTSATTCEILDYVERNFECDGDVEAQVRTALKRTCCQGYVKKLGPDAYRLVGPLACQLAKTQISNSRKPSPKSDTRRCPGNSRCPSRSPPRCNRDSGDANLSQESSEIDLSIPSSTEADILRNRIERDIERLEGRENSSEVAANSTMNFGIRQRVRNPRLEQSERRRGCGEGNQSAGMPSGQSTPARHSESQESDAIVGAVANPVRDLEIGVHLPDFEDDDSEDEDELTVVPDDLDDSDDDEEEEDDDPTSDESVLRSIRADDSGSSGDDARDLELKRWIRSCRKECVKRARETAARAELNQQ